MAWSSAGSLSVPWSNVTGKPSTFAPSAHSHAAGDVTSGTFAAARIPNLDASKITTGYLGVGRGGTGGSSYQTAARNLKVPTLQAGTAIPANADLDSSTYFVPGVYTCSSTSTAATVQNSPTPNAFTLIVSCELTNNTSNYGEAQYTMQRVLQYNSGYMWFRMWDNYNDEWMTGAGAGGTGWQLLSPGYRSGTGAPPSSSDPGSLYVRY